VHRHYWNGVKTALLLGLLSSIILVVGGSVWGRQGLVVALLVALAMNGYAYFASDKIALASMRAYPVTQAQQPVLYAIVAELANNYRMPMPRIYVSPTAQPNAFATGRNPRHASVCCTEGILALLSDRELRGVLGHELSHVANRDILISSVAAALASVVMFMAMMARFAAIFGGFGGRDDRDGNIVELLAIMLFGPMAAGLIQMAISRAREYQADASGARITGDPLALASALRKIDYHATRMPLQQRSNVVSTGSMMIANPFRRTGVARLFGTHPPMADRIARLEEMAGQRLAG
jgi:heat shock protein HtpX